MLLPKEFSKVARGLHKLQRHKYWDLAIPSPAYVVFGCSLWQKLAEANHIEWHIFYEIQDFDLDKIYNFSFNEKIVTSKHLPLHAFVIATLENSFGRNTLNNFPTYKGEIGQLFDIYEQNLSKYVTIKCSVQCTGSLSTDLAKVNAFYMPLWWKI